jgi:hypothetical protein
MYKTPHRSNKIIKSHKNQILLKSKIQGEGLTLGL